MTQLVVLGPILKPLTLSKGLQCEKKFSSDLETMLKTLHTECSFAMSDLPVCDHGSHKMSVLIYGYGSKKGTQKNLFQKMMDPVAMNSPWNEITSLLA